MTDILLSYTELDTFSAFMDELDEKKEYIATHFNLFSAKSKRGSYLYDFGDDWAHDILLENILPRVDGKNYPVCIAGKYLRLTNN